MTERIASGEAAAKALWDQAVADNLNLSRLDRLDGVGTKTVHFNDTPRLQDEAPPVPASSVTQPFPSILPAEPRSKVLPFVGIVVALTGLLVVLITWMAGAA